MEDTIQRVLLSRQKGACFSMTLFFIWLPTLTSGDIPIQLTRLVELRTLNLSGNHLKGLIPNDIGDMKQMESLDLSRNSLSGEIPDSMAVLTSLNYLNLSYNNLTGRILQSTHIMTLPASGLIGNTLCGPPLTSNCDNDGENETPGLTHEEDDGVDKSEVEWLYVFISTGYIVGLSIVFNIMIFKKTWRNAIFESFDNLWNKVYVYVIRTGSCLAFVDYSSFAFAKDGIRDSMEQFLMP